MKKKISIRKRYQLAALCIIGLLSACSGGSKTQKNAYEEERLAGKSFGSTKSGIAPCYSDKYAKIGFQVNELFMPEKELRERIENVCTIKNTLIKHLYQKPELDADELFQTMMEYKEMIKPYAGNTSAFLYNALSEGKNILLEGQLGSMKDIDN